MINFVETRRLMPHLPQADCDILDRAQRIANRVYRDFKDAQDSWTVLQNLQSRIDSNTDFSAALTRSVPGGLRQINNALFMNTVMGLMRMSDDPGSKDDRQSACSLTGILRNQIVLQAVCTDDWLTRHLSVPNDAVLRIERLEQPKRIARFLSIVPLGWNKGDRRPNPDKLGSVREILRGLRTEVYAHSLEANGTRVPRPSDIVATLDLSFEIASGAALIFLGSSLGLRKAVDPRMHELGGVWNDLEFGISRRHAEWQKQKDAIEDE